MKPRTIGKSTRLDWLGRVHLSAQIRRRAGLKPGPVEFVLDDSGGWIIQNVKLPKKGQRMKSNSHD